jgi:hypothetical protein
MTYACFLNIRMKICTQEATQASIFDSISVTVNKCGFFGSVPKRCLFRPEFYSDCDEVQEIIMG